MKNVLSALLGLCLIFLALPANSEDTAITDAKNFFKLYSEQERNFDPSMADLYAPTATIKDVRIYQDGQNQTLTWTGESYKQIIRAQMPVAKARGEQNLYSQISYQKEPNGIRIKCNRYCSQKKFAAPMELLISSAARGGYKITEAYYQSQP